MTKIRQELYYGLQSNYSKPSDTTMPINEVEEWLNAFPDKRAENKPNGGITKSTEAIIFIDNANYKNQTAKEKRQSTAKAQRDYNQALRNIKEHSDIDAKAVKKQATIWRAEKIASDKLKIKQAAAAAVLSKRKVKAENKAALKKHKEEEKVAKNKVSIVSIRRNAIIESLKSGEKIELVTGSSKSQVTLYQKQRMDLKAIVKTTSLNIKRVKSIKEDKSYFILDDFKRHEMKQVSGALNLDDRKDLLKAICSNELVQIESIDSGSRIGAASMTRLARKHGFDIYTLFDARAILGWILIDG